MNKQPTKEYDFLSRAFHWVTAVVVMSAFVLGPGDFGQIMRQGIDPATRNDIVWHESLGIFIFSMTVLRLLWVAFRPSVLQTKMPRWMQVVGTLVHVVLWILLLALPTTALLSLGSESHPLTLLWDMRVDKLNVISNSSIAKLADWGDVHKFLGDVIVWIAGFHAAAAIFHHVILKDGVLSAMLPYRWFRRSGSDVAPEIRIS